MKVYVAVTPYTANCEFVAFKVHDVAYGELLPIEYDTLADAADGAKGRRVLYRHADEAVQYLNELSQACDSVASRDGTKPPVCLEPIKVFLGKYGFAKPAKCSQPSEPLPQPAGN